LVKDCAQDGWQGPDAAAATAAVAAVAVAAASPRVDWAVGKAFVAAGTSGPPPPPPLPPPSLWHCTQVEHLAHLQMMGHKLSDRSSNSPEHHGKHPAG
jgi:hypothetical protein